MLSRVFSLILLLFLSACVYVPVVQDAPPEEAACKTLTKDLSLETRDFEGGGLNQGCNRNQECLNALLMTATVVTAGSAIISGSIVLTGKTIHWLEYQGTCSDGYLAKTKRLFLNAFSSDSPNSKQPTIQPLSKE